MNTALCPFRYSLQRNFNQVEPLPGLQYIAITNQILELLIMKIKTLCLLSIISLCALTSSYASGKAKVACGEYDHTVDPDQFALASIRIFDEKGTELEVTDGSGRLLENDLPEDIELDTYLCARIKWVDDLFVSLSNSTIVTLDFENVVGTKQDKHAINKAAKERNEKLLMKTVSSLLKK